MKKALFILALSCFSCLLNAQEKQDSVTIRLETSAGAEIGIDGDISSTNILHKKVAMGKHVVTVKFGSSFMKEYELEVNPGDEHTYRYPINGKVDIQTTPAGASVFIDGLPQGKAPLAVEMLGDHNIRIEADPLVYYDLTERISVNPFENLTRNFTLAKRPPRLYGMAMATWSPSGLGGFLGICRRFGAYMRFETSLGGTGFGNLSPVENLPEGETPTGPGYYHKDDHTYSSFTTGMMMRCHKYVYAYVGAGYGEYAQKYALDTEVDNPPSATPELYPYGSKGCALDLGAILKWKALLVSCGYTTILGNSYPKRNRHNEVYIGVGVSIHKHNKR